MMRRLALALGVLLGLGLLAEAVLRFGVGLGDPPLAVLDPETEYQLVPDRSYRRWGRRIEINRHGLRGPDFAAEPAPDERRVLLIGDSIVYGNHFLDQDETLGVRLAERLSAEAHLAGCRVLTVAMAASSWGPVNQAAFLARTGPLGAMAAVIVVSAHDLHDTPDAPGPARILPYRLAAPAGALGDAIEAMIERFGRPDLPPPALSREIRARASLDALDRMAARLTDAGLPPVLVYHPTRTERAAGPAPAKAVLTDWAAGAGVPVVDLAQAIPEPSHYRDDIHPDPEGADQIAAALAPVLAPRLPPCPAG